MQDSQYSYKENGLNFYSVPTNKMLHEQVTQKEEHEYQLKCKERDQKHEKELLNTNLGVIGRLLGSAEHASKNITASICILLILGVSVISCWVYYKKQDIAFIKSMWTSISPIITLSLGYLFGKK